MSTSFINNPRHLYRALLREASYLFHPRVKEYHLQFIRSSFRHQRAVGRRLDDDEQVRERELRGFPSKYETQQLRRGRKQLYILQRANNGHTRALENVLRATFARSGRRRRQLMQTIMHPEVEANSEQAVRQPHREGWKPPGQFTELFQSQSRVAKVLSGRGSGLKQMEKLPEHTKSGKPLPETRKQNIVRKWYSIQADRILPPLDEAEWLEVYNMTQEWQWEIPPRRKCASGSISNEEDGLNPEYLVRTSPQANSMSKRVKAWIGDPHHMTPRFLTRIVRRVVLENTPVAILDPKTNRSVYRWELGVKVPPKKTMPSPSQAITLFG